MRSGERPPDGRTRLFAGLTRNVVVLSWVSFFQDAASEMLYPVLPLFLTGVLGAPPSVVGLIEGVGEGRGDTLKNPVTGEDHIVNVDLPTGFIWKKGEVGQGSFRASAAGLSVEFNKTNFIYYQYDWSNAA